MYKRFRKNVITKKSGGGGGISKPKKPSDNEDFASVNISQPTINKTQKKCTSTDKKCGFCKQTGHTVAKCTSLADEFKRIEDYCSNVVNQVNLPETRKFLSTIDKDVIRRYIAKHNISNYMYENCSQYYDNNINLRDNKKNNIELIIGYLCVLPLHPEIKIKRQRKQTQQPVKQKQTQRELGFDFGRSAVVYTSDGPKIGHTLPKFTF